MMFIQDGGYAIETEAIGVVLFEPEADVGEKETLDFVLGVVEDSAVPL